MRIPPDARVPAALLVALSIVVIAAGIAPAAGHLSYLLEVVPGLVGVVVLARVYRRFSMSHWVYWCVFLHVLILTYGGYYTYAETPLGNWARDTFGLSRNHYDRVGHVALGVFPAFVVKEVLLRRTPLRAGGWLWFLIGSVILAVAAAWEILEWWTTLIVASDTGIAFLGSQGDIWDAQWDMLLAVVGCAIALPVFNRAHDRSMARVTGSPPS